MGILSKFWFLIPLLELARVRDPVEITEEVRVLAIALPEPEKIMPE